MKRITKIESSRADIFTKPKLQVAAYCRVSTGSEEQLVSLEAQKKHYESYIKANPEWEFAGLYYDQGVTGTKKEKRGELLRMVSDCEDGKIDFIVTKSLSRFARNTTDCLELVRKLTDLGVYIYFEKENLSTQSMESELMLSILSSLAESESVSISENNKWSVQRRFQNGTYKVAYPPYGYSSVDGQMVVNEEQAENVRWMFDAVLAGKGTHRIASELNARGVPTKKGGSWTASTVRGLLSNEKFTGDILFQKTYTDSHFNRHANHGEKDMYYMENHHPAIVSRETFEAVAAVISQRGKEKGVTKGSKYQNRYPFSGRIICSECGGTFKRRIHYSTHQKYIAWCCSRHIEKKEDCSMQFIRNDAVEAAFTTMMNKLVYGHRKILRPLLDSLRRVDDDDSYHRVNELEERIEAAMERGQVLAGLMTKGYLEPALFNREKSELAAELEHLQGQKDILIKMMNGNLSKIEEVSRFLKFASKSEMLKTFDSGLFEEYVNRIIVYSRTEVGFELKCGITLKERLVR